VYVHRIFAGTDYEKRIEKRTVRLEEEEKVNWAGVSHDQQITKASTIIYAA
jgi:hypothetical protein